MDLLGPRRRASVLFPMPLPEPFDYEIPDGLEVRPGDHVLAPLGKRVAPGVVWSVGEHDGARALKPLDAVRGGPPLQRGVRDFIDWTARYLVEPPGVILRAVLRSPAALRPSPVETVFHPTGAQIARLTPARRAVIEAAGEGAASAAELARRAGVSSSVVKGLAEECRKQGVKLGFYYSQTQDWHHPDGDGNYWDFDAADQDFDSYIHDYVILQLEELLSNYGPIGLIWFDTPKGISRDQSQDQLDAVYR
ncbi:MAG: alpha-L-fucosidase, partial [Oceanicaulis sp.]